MESKVTFAAQDDLPSLPVPDLDQTLEKYIQSVKVSAEAIRLLV